MPLIIVESEARKKRNDVVENGLADYGAVDAVGKLATTWALLKTKR